jgi:hypothetical protein
VLGIWYVCLKKAFNPVHSCLEFSFRYLYWYVPAQKYTCILRHTIISHLIDTYIIQGITPT